MTISVLPYSFELDATMGQIFSLPDVPAYETTMSENDKWNILSQMLDAAVELKTAENIDLVIRNATCADRKRNFVGVVRSFNHDARTLKTAYFAAWGMMQNERAINGADFIKAVQLASFNQYRQSSGQRAVDNFLHVFRALVDAIDTIIHDYEAGK